MASLKIRNVQCALYKAQVLHLMTVLFILIFANLSFAVCNGEASHFIPAVVEEGGGLVGIHVKAVPGIGEVYITTFPHTGVVTQQSIDNAVAYVFSKVNQPFSECNILVSIDGNIAEYVDGPSAGIALSVLTYAAVENQPIRNDATVTGSVDKSGNVGRVGGLYEKARAISKDHIKYFLTPQHTLHERVLLSHIKQISNIEIIEIDNADEAIDFMVFNKSIEKKLLVAPDRSLPNIPFYDSSDLQDFRNITLDLIDLENTEVNKIPENDQDIKEIKDLFLNEINRQQKLVEKGYTFSAANDAFLDYIDASTVVDVSNPDAVDLKKKYVSIKACLDSLPNNKKTDNDFEWLIGSDLRKAWAVQKIDSLDINGKQLAEEKYFLYNELMYGDAWCKISGLLAKNGLRLEGGKEIDETAWKLITQKKILDAQKLNITSEDLLNHFETAKLLFNQGKYGAAAFDTTFVLSMYESEKDLSSSSSSLLVTSNINRLKNTKRLSLWGKIYQTQGVFLTENGDSDQLSAYKLLKYAEDLDKLADELRGSVKLAPLNSMSASDSSKSKDINSFIQPSKKQESQNINCLPGYIFLFVITILHFKKQK